MSFYFNPGTITMNAAKYLSLLLLAVSVTSSVAQPAPADSATDEAVRRQAALITARKTFAEGKGAQDKSDFVVASELYEEAYKLAPSVRVRVAAGAAPHSGPFGLAPVAPGR